MTRKLRSVSLPDEWTELVAREISKLKPLTEVPLDVLDGLDQITLHIRLTVISLTDRLYMGYTEEGTLINVHVSDSEVLAVLPDREESQ